MTRLEKILLVAFSYHLGQKDKGGQPYILHLLHVMDKMETEKERIVAVCHDIIEDTEATFDKLIEWGYFELDELEAISALTRLEGEEYMDFIMRCKANPLAHKVKIEDIKHNLDLSRLGTDISESDRNRAKKYTKALALLEQG